MKKYLKKIVSLICVLTLGVGTMHITAKAGTTYNSTMTIGTKLDSNSAFYVNGTDGVTTSDLANGWGGQMKAIDAESGVYVNGEIQSQGYIQKCNSTAYYVCGFDAVNEGDVVTIKGTFGPTCDGDYINVAAADFLYIGSQWVDCYTGSLNIKNAQVSGANNTQSNNFYLRGTDGLEVGMPFGSADWANYCYVPFTEADGVFLNGVRQTSYFQPTVSESGIKLVKYWDTDYYYITGIEGVETSTTVAIKGSFLVYTPAGSLKAAVIIEESNFKWNGTCWEEFYVGSLTVDSATNAEMGSSATLFYIKGTDRFPLPETDDDNVIWDSTIIPIDGDVESGIFINDVRIENYYSAQADTEGYVRLRKYTDGGYHIQNLPGIVEGSIVTIKGTFKVYTNWLVADVFDTTPIVFEESSFKWTGTQWVDYVGVDVYEGSLSITGAETTSINAGGIYLKGTDGYRAESGYDWDASGVKLQPAADDRESGIYLNGEKQGTGLLKKYYGSNNWYYAEGFTATSFGDVVTIKGTFYSDDELAKVTFTENSFLWTGENWVACYQSSLTVTGALSKSDNAAAIYLKGTDDYLKDSTEILWDISEANLSPRSDDTTSGVFLNGVRLTSTDLNGDLTVNVRFRKICGASNYYYVERLTASNIGDIITIKGSFFTKDGLTSVKFAESSFWWNGKEWHDYTAGNTYYESLTVVSGAADHMYLTPSATEEGGELMPDQNWEWALYPFGDSGLELNGNKLENGYMKKVPGGNWYTGELGAKEGDILTIKGTFGYSENCHKVVFEEKEFQFEGNCWVEPDKLVDCKEGTLWLDTNQTSSATQLYLRGSVDIHDDCTPESNPVLGWETPVGTTGFYKNGVACSGVLKNTTNGGGWYLGLENAGVTDGDQLTIKGTYCYAGNYVRFAEYNLWYADGRWTITPAITTDTKVYGDTNGDASVNSIDIVRIKRYLADQPVSVYRKHKDGDTVYATGANANGVDGINDKDRIKIYELILEGKQYLVGEGYTVDYYPVYLDDEDVKLGAYHGPRMAGKQDYTWDGSKLSSITDERNFLTTAEFNQYKEAGLNTLLHEQDGAYSSKTAGLGYGVDDGNLKEYFRLAKEAGLDVYVTSLGLFSYVKYEGAGNGATSIDFNGDGSVTTDTITIDETKYGWDYNGNGTIGSAEQMTEIFYYSDAIKNAEGKTILEADIEEMLDFIVANGYEDIFRGFMMSDEPWLVSADRYASAVALIKSEAVERGLTVEFQGCLYPSYAQEDYIGSDYANYINAFGKSTGSIMYDFYPLQKTKNWYDSSFSNVLNESWLTNLQTVAAQGKENGYTTGITLQSCGYEFDGDSGIFANESYRRNPQSDADMQFQVYSALAFGMKKINYFTYWEHPNQSSSGEWFTSSMVEYPATGETIGKKTAVYGYVQNANDEITAFDHIFMDYDWQGTISAGSSSLFSGLAEYSTDKVTVNSATGSAIVSHMYDSEKNLDGYWLVNVAEPSGTSTATLKVTFSGKNKAMVFVDGEKQIVDLTNGVYEANLPVGEGIFIIPLDIQ